MMIQNLSDIKDIPSTHVPVLIILDVPRRNLLRGACSFGPTFVVVSAALNHIQIFQGEGMN